MIRRVRNFGPADEGVLCSGWDFFGDSRLSRPGVRRLDFSSPEVRRAWEACRESCLARYAQVHPGRRPCAWWVFESGVEFPGDVVCSDVEHVLGMPQAAWLAARGLLGEGELARLEARP